MHAGKQATEPLVMTDIPDRPYSKIGTNSPVKDTGTMSTPSAKTPQKQLNKDVRSSKPTSQSPF